MVLIIAATLITLVGIAAAVHLGRPLWSKPHLPRLEVAWRDMTAAGDLLIDALRLEQEFNETDPTKAEGDELERWRLHRNTVECIAEDYASAVSKWREALQVECLPQNTRLSN